MWHAREGAPDVDAMHEEPADEEREIDVLLAKVHRQFQELDALTLKIYPDAVKAGFLAQEDAVAARLFMAQQGGFMKQAESGVDKEKHGVEDTRELGLYEHTAFELPCSRALTPVTQCSNTCPGSPVPYVTFTREGSIAGSIAGSVGNWSSPARSVRFARDGSVQTWHSPFKLT
jgi:hypothetical protein